MWLPFKFPLSLHGLTQLLLAHTYKKRHTCN